MNTKLLRIYLNDHLAASVAGAEIARRCLNSNQESELGDYLHVFLREIDEDRTVLEMLMTELGFNEDRVKMGAAWTAEKVGRLKLNGQITGYSPLSRVIELEALVAGVTARGALWAALKTIENHDPRLATLDLDHLMKRAEEQREELERFRRDAAVEAFA